VVLGQNGVLLRLDPGVCGGVSEAGNLVSERTREPASRYAAICEVSPTPTRLPFRPMPPHTERMASVPQANQRDIQENPITHDAARLSSTEYPYLGQRGVAAGIVLPSANLSKCAAFYARILGTDIAVRGRTLRIAPWLLLRESDRASARAAGAVGEIVLTVPDVDALMERLKIDPASRRKDTIMLRDPDGRTVFIEQGRTVPTQSSSLADLRSRSKDILHGNFELFRDEVGAFRYHMRAADGEITAISKGYQTMDEAERAIKSAKTLAKFILFMESAADIFPRRKK
jgi:uncharacterized protein YegP (UPF0339 family)